MLIESSNNHMKIGDWQVEPLRTRIRRREQVRSVQPLSMDILVHLARRAGEVVTTDELIDEFWPGRYVGSDAVHRRIADLRRALGDDRSEPRYIETIRKRGYRLIAEVQCAEIQHTDLQGQQAAELLLDALDHQRDLHLEFELKNGKGTLARGTLSLSANAAGGVSPPATRPGCRSRYRAGS